MQSPSRLPLLLLFLLSAAVPGPAQDPEANLKIPPPPTAVEYDAKAWREFSPPAGGFAVLLPGRPDRTGASVETEMGLMRWHLFPLLTETATYMVSYAELPFTPADPDAAEKLLDRAVGRAAGMDQNKLLSASRISLVGRPGRRFEVEVPHLDCVMNGKVYLINNRLYTLAVTTRRYGAAPKETAGFYEAVIGKFLDSFRFVSGNPRPGGARRAVGRPRKKNIKP